MFSHLSPRNQLGMWGIVAIFLVGLLYVGGRELRQPAPMTIRELPETKPSPSPPPEAEGEVVVHVAGAVKRSTVLHAKPGDRVQDAVRDVGGHRPDADLEAINLAAKLEDGTQLYVPKKGEAAEDLVAEIYAGGPKAPSRYAARTKGKSRRTASKSSGPTGPVSLNTGTIAQLDSLPGIGPATAQKILEYRHAHGGFSSIDELLAVPGIGAKKLEKMRKWLRL